MYRCPVMVKAETRAKKFFSQPSAHVTVTSLAGVTGVRVRVRAQVRVRIRERVTQS